MSNKFNLSKGLLDTVSGIVSTSKQQHVEQNTQFNTAMRSKTKIDEIRPLTAEQLADVPKREAKDLALYNTIRGIASQSAAEAANEQQTAAGRINSMYRTSGGRGRNVTEARKLDPVGKEDSDVNNDGKINKSDSYLKNRRQAIGAAIKEEQVEEGVMSTVKKYAKKALEKVGGGSDEDQLKRLQKNMGVPQTGKKPEVKEDVEQVDELSRMTLTNYVNKVAKKKGAQAGAHDSGLKTAAKKIAMKKKLGEEATLSTEEVEQVDEAERSAGTVFDKDVAKSFSKKKPGELTGHESKKTSTGTVYTKKAKKQDDEDVKEEIEQVDELSKGTMKSYIGKAVDRVSDTQFRAGKHWEKGNNKSADYESRETIKRMRGIHKAVGKLTKEDVQLSAEETARLEEIAKTLDK